MVIIDLWGMAFDAGIVIAPIYILLLESIWACCGANPCKHTFLFFQKNFFLFFFMQTHANPCKPMQTHTNPCKPMQTHTKKWVCMGLHGFAWVCMGLHEIFFKKNNFF